MNLDSIDDRLTSKTGPKHFLLGADGFVLHIDNLTIGSVDGKSFNTGQSTWDKKDQLRWAGALAVFYQSVTDKLFAYAELIKKEINEDLVAK